MTLANFPALMRLPKSARLKIAEELWDSAVSDNLSVPASHKHLIRARRAAYVGGETKTLSMPELKRSFVVGRLSRSMPSVKTSSWHMITSKPARDLVRERK